MELAEKIDTQLEESPIKIKASTKSYNLFKRIFDLTFALLLLPFLIPVMALVAILIKIDSRGSVFFNHTRTGENGKLFNCLKFRTMVKNASALRSKLTHLNEMSGPVFKIKADPRTTKLGRFLRQYSIDELPQIFNILKGDMSFVGPRPPLPDEVKEYKPWHKKRLSVKPGLTCFWQISGRNNIKNFDEWVKMDLAYIDTASFIIDLKIILKTVPAVLFRKGAY